MTVGVRLLTDIWSPEGVALTPDGLRYLQAAEGGGAPGPFRLRPLWPKLLGADPVRWLRINRVLLIATAGLVAVYGGGARGVFAGLLFLALPAPRLWWRCPVLVDTPGLFFALLAAVLPFPLNLIAVLVGAGVRETVPLWAAVFAWNPLLLCGLAVPAALWRREEGPDPCRGYDHWFILHHPIKTGLRWHRDQWLSWRAMLAPWGLALIGLAHPSLPLVAALILGYGQLVAATDTVRLYQYAAPLLCVAACIVVPVWALPVLILGTWFNPWRGDGI